MFPLCWSNEHGSSYFSSAMVQKMRISERLISDVFIKNIWMVLKKCVFLWTIYK